MTKTKFLTAKFIKTAKEEGQPMTIWAVASAPTIDRDRELIRADAWDLMEFRRHPVLILSHDYQKLWIARVEEITSKADGLYFKAVFARTKEAEDVADLIRSTGMAAFSVGFLPIASENVPVKKLAPADQREALRVGLTMDGSIRVYTRVSLLEISIVSVPSQIAATLLNWKALAKSAELRAALEEITIEDSPEITIEDGPTQEALAAEVRELRAKLNEIALAHLTPDEIKGLPAGFRERLKSFRRPEITIGAAEKSIEEFIAEYVRSGDYKKAVKEAVEVAIAKVRGKVI